MSNGASFFDSLETHMGSRGYSAWKTRMGDYMEKHSCFMFDIAENNQELAINLDFYGDCTKYGRIEVLQYLYDIGVFEAMPILKADELAPCDDPSRALPVAEWLYTHFIVQSNELLLWALSNGYKKVLKLAIAKGWRSENFEEQIEYFIRCHTQDYLDIAYKLGFFSTLDASTLFSDDRIEIHHIKWLFLNQEKPEFNNLDQEFSWLTGTTYKIFNMCGKHDLHLFKMLLDYSNKIIECNLIEDEEARSLIEAKHCGCGQEHKSNKRLKF